MSRSPGRNSVKCAGNTLNGSNEAGKIISQIISITPDINHAELEQSCREALISLNDIASLEKFDATKSQVKKSNDAKVLDIFHSGLSSSLTSLQIKNQSLRFGFDDQLGSAKGPTWGNFVNGKGFFGVLGTSPSNGSIDSREYEDVTSSDILDAPICDICIIQRGEPVPEGYFRILKSPTNRKASLNVGSGGNNIYLCIKKDLANESYPITAIIVFFPDKNEFLPPGFVPAKFRGKHPCNLNSGTNAERVFLAFKRDYFSNPITDIQVIFPTKMEEIPKSFCLLDKSPSGLEANLNAGTSGVKTMICYRQRLIRLECLKNEPITDRSDTYKDSPKQGKSRHQRSSLVGTPPSSSIFKSSSMSNLPGKNSHASTPDVVSHDVEYISSKNDESMTRGKNKGESMDILNDERISESGGEFDLYDEYETTSVINDSIFGSHFDKQIVVDSDGRIAPSESRKALHAILSSLYAHHDGLTDIALTGLTILLKDTDFFANDMKAVSISGSVTMLDVMIDAVCDRFDTCSNALHEKILQYFRTLIRYISGRFSSLSLQKVYRLLHYIHTWS